MMKSDVLGEIKQYLREKKLVRGGIDVDDDASLLEAGLIDSLGIVELTAFMEQRLGISIDEDDLIPDNFDSFRAIEAFVSRKRGGAGQ